MTSGDKGRGEEGGLREGHALYIRRRKKGKKISRYDVVSLILRDFKKIGTSRGINLDAVYIWHITPIYYLHMAHAFTPHRNSFVFYISPSFSLQSERAIVSLSFSQCIGD